MQALDTVDASMFEFDAATSPTGSPIAPQPRSRFASVVSESNPDSPVGPVNARPLNTQLPADAAYSNTDRNDMTQYLAFQDLDAQNLGAVGAVSVASPLLPHPLPFRDLQRPGRLSLMGMQLVSGAIPLSHNCSPRSRTCTIPSTSYRG